jgi:hypothetical protein
MELATRTCDGASAGFLLPARDAIFFASNHFRPGDKAGSEARGEHCKLSGANLTAGKSNRLQIKTMKQQRGKSRPVK